MGLVRKVLRIAVHDSHQDIFPGMHNNPYTKHVVVFSGDIVDSRGVNAASKDRDLILENYRVMWKALIDIVHGEFGCEVRLPTT